jgi:hypothetical protein
MAVVLVKTALLTLGLNYGVHYTSARIYDMVCLPHSLTEVFQSLAATASPVCGFLLNVMSNTQSNYANVLTVTLTSAVANALRPTS